MVTAAAACRRGVFEPRTPIDLPEKGEVTLHVADREPIDPRDALLDDPDALRALYAECAEVDRELASRGLVEWVQSLDREERQA